MAEEDTSFASRWSRRKAMVREGRVPSDNALPLAQQVPEPVPATATAVTAPTVEQAAEPTAQPAPTLAEVASLNHDSDFTRFVANNVAPDVKNAALKKLFTDPHFNLMDGLDTYIDDYGKPDPLPLSMLRKMNGAAFLGLFTEDEAQPEASVTAPAPARPHLAAPCPDEDLDLQLQPQHAAGCEGAQPGAGQDPAGEP